MKSHADPIRNPDFSGIIHDRRAQKNLSQTDLAHLLYCDTSSVANWETGRSRPPLELIPRLCDILEIPLDSFFQMPQYHGELSPAEMDAIGLYHRLNAHDRAVIDHLIASIHLQQKQRLRRRCLTDFVTLRRIDHRSVFLPGAFSEESGDPVFVRRSFLTETASFVVTVEGDDMEPDYADGCDVYVRSAKTADPGDIVCAAVNGEICVREFRPGLLHALNLKRGDRTLIPSDHLYILGIVIGSVSQSDLPGSRESEMLEILDHEHNRYRTTAIKRTSR